MNKRGGFSAKENGLGGLWTALVTPFAQEGIDWAGLARLISMQIEAGVTGVVLAGTTGESPVLLDAEYAALLEFAVKQAAGRMRVFAGIGTPSTAHSLERLRLAHTAGVDGVMVVTPYYNKPTQAGLYAHFSTLAQQTQLPMMLYSVPSRCVVQIAEDTLSRLYEHFPHCCMLKESSSDCVRFSRLYQSLGPNFCLLAGDDFMSLPFIALGAKGLVSVASNRFPKELKALVGAGLDGDLRSARQYYHRLRPFFETLFLETNPAPIKGILAQSGIIEHNELRLPLVPASSQTLKQAVEASLLVV